MFLHLHLHVKLGHFRIPALTNHGKSKVSQPAEGSLCAQTLMLAAYADRCVKISLVNAFEGQWPCLTLNEIFHLVSLCHQYVKGVAAWWLAYDNFRVLWNQITLGHEIIWPRKVQTKPRPLLDASFNVSVPKPWHFLFMSLGTMKLCL